MKVSKKIENVFAHAVALDQSGRFRNTIYCVEDQIFIMNSDNTTLLRFGLDEAIFEALVSFRANDYDSKEFYIQDNKIVFETKDGDYVRKKFCGVPEANAEDIKNLYEGFPIPDSTTTPVIIIHKGMLKLLNENLSHVEFSTKQGVLKIAQRNIYDGSLIEITKNPFSQGLMDLNPDWIPGDFGPIGMRTNDFLALYSFHDSIEFTLGSWGWFSIRGLRAKLGGVEMTGIVSWCIYDELGVLETVLEGLKEPKTESRRTKKRRRTT